MQVISHAVNLTTNPKPASLTGITGPVNLAYEKSYSGQTSVRVTFSAGDDSFEWVASTDLSDIDPGAAFSGAINVLPPVTVTIQLEVILTYSDTTEDNALGDEIEITSGNHWVRQNLPTLVSNPAKTPESIRVVVHKTSTDAAEMYVGGLDVREGPEPIDAFVVGDGYNSYWMGTANASRSVRNAHSYESKLTLGAQLRYSVNYFLVNRMNVIEQEITDRVLSCSINVDLLAEATKSSINIALDSGDIIQPFTDSWIRPHLTIEHSDGTIEGGLGPEGMLGVYSVEPATEVYDANRNTFTYQGYDLLWILEQESIVRFDRSYFWDHEQGKAWIISPPKDLHYALTEVFKASGFTQENGLLSLPAPAGLPPLDQVYSAETGTSVLSFITAICDGMAWRRPWATLQGQIKTEPIRQLADEQPDYYFATGVNSPVRWPFEIQPEPENIANRVTVFSKKQGTVATVINEVIENADPNHPFSTVRLGYELPEGQTFPDGSTVQKRYIDAPQIDAVLLNNIEEARVIGRAELEKRGMLPYVARLKTRSMVAQLNSVYELNLTDFEGNPMANQAGQGKYWCIGWQMNLGPPWEMTHNLRRIIPVFDEKEIDYPQHWYVPGKYNHTEAMRKLRKQIKNLKKKIKDRGLKGPTKQQTRDLKAKNKQMNQLRNQHRDPLPTVWTDVD